MGPTETPLASLRDRPSEFVGRSITTRGWLVRAGDASGGTWFELVENGAAPGQPLVLALSAAVQPADLQGMVGQELELGLQIERPVALPDGRPALAAMPLQIMTAMKPVAPGTQMPADLSKELETASKALREGAVEMFRDPGFTPSDVGEPTVRMTFLDPNLEQPLWTKPGPVVVERSGNGYAVRQTMHSDDGGTRDVVCRFRVEAGNLRSVGYDETLKRPNGQVVSEEHLDFLNGSGFDHLSGKSYRWPKNIYAGSCLSFALSGFPFGEKVAVNFFMWSDYDAFTTMYAIADGMERVTVPAGTFDCFRIRVNVNTEHIIQNLDLPMAQAYDIARGVADQMRPQDMLFWYTAEPPHLFVKMQGPMGAPGTTRGVVERTRLTDAERAALGASQLSR